MKPETEILLWFHTTKENCNTCAISCCVSRDIYANIGIYIGTSNANNNMTIIINNNITQIGTISRIYKDKEH